MPSLQIIRTTSEKWCVPIPVPGVLHAASAVSAPRQEAGQRDACGHREIRGESWPGCNSGVRAPDPGETCLSWAEVHHGVREGDLWTA